MSGDTFNFNNNQTGDGAVAQQAHTISGDAVTTVNNTSDDERKLGTFFESAAMLAAMPANTAALDIASPDAVVQLIPQAVEQVAKTSPELVVDKTVAPDALPLHFVMSELGKQASLPETERDVPLIKQMLRVVHDQPVQALRIVGRISLAFGKGWITSMVAKNPIFAATLAAIDVAESLVSKDPPAT